MIESTLNDFIMSGCYGETKRYNKHKELFPYDIEKYTNGQWTYVVEIMILTTKSLVPSIDKPGTIIDYLRFDEELKLWLYYRHGKNDALIKATGIYNDESYWRNFDDSVFSRVSPIVAANQNWDIIKHEVIKNVLYTTGNIQVVLESILLSKLLYLLLDKTNISYDEIISCLKEEIIGLSQKHFILDYKQFFRTQLEEYKGNYLIDFERNRIDMINLLNDISKPGRYEVLSRCLEMLKVNKNTSENANFFINGLSGLINKDIQIIEIKDKSFIQSLCSYLIKLRKGRIATESLKMNSYNEIDIFSYAEGDIFTHPLLNKCKVLTRKKVNDVIVVYISSKSGIYRFFKKESNMLK